MGRTEGRAIAQPDPLLGTTLLDRYRVLECIGAGAMGAVYRAEQVGLGRPVALKVLKKQQDSGTDVVARFEREAKAMSALAHPNTVRVYDFGATPQGLLFLAMELLEGELATSRLGRSSEVTTAEAIEWVQQVLRSLAEAHTKGIIHRDIKPDNIFLARVEGQAEPVAKVLDFGIAKSIEGDRKLDQFETLDGTVFGTPRYMSPEQAQGKPLDHRTDLYAVGIVLYELLVGAPPFVDKDAVIVMAKHIREEPAPLRVAAPMRTFPASLQRVLDKALNKAPALRFQSAEEFEHALTRCLRDAELIDHVPRSGRKLLAAVLAAPTWTRWTLGAGAALLVAAATSTLALGNDQLRAPREVAERQPQPAPSRPADPAPTPAAPAAAAPAPSPAPQTQTHSVMLSSQPSGANVWNYSRFVGVTPLPLEVQDGRSLRLRVSMEGYATQTIDLSPSESARALKLEPLHGAAAVPETAELSRPARRRSMHKATARHGPTPSQSAAPSSTPTSDSYEKFSP